MSKINVGEVIPKKGKLEVNLLIGKVIPNIKAKPKNNNRTVSKKTPDKGSNIKKKVGKIDKESNIKKNVGEIDK